MRAVAVLTVAYATLAFAQSNNSSKTYSVEDLGAWFNDVTPRQKRDWCLGQTNSCRELCNRNTNSNECSTTTLEYECTCSDGSTPELQKYTQTLPTHICQYVYDRCTESHPNDLEGKQECEDAWNASCHPDNLLDSSEAVSDATTTTTVAATTTTAEESESPTASGTSSAAGSETTGTSGDNGSFAAPTAAPVAGAAALAMGLMAYLL